MPDPKLPSQMTDEELEQVINPAEPEEPETPEPDVPEPEVEAEESAEPVVPDEPEEPAEPEVPKVSRREQLRVSDLLEKFKQPVETPKPQPIPDAIDYGQFLDTDPEAIEKLNADRNRTNEAFYKQGVEQANSIRFLNRLEIDGPKMEGKYKFLDKDSEEFNPVAADAMNQKYLQFVGYDRETQKVVRPDIRYSDFVEAEIEFANEIADHKIAEAAKNIKRQAAQTGLRPDGSSSKKLNLSKAPEQMTDEELDAVIALGVPKR